MKTRTLLLTIFLICFYVAKSQIINVLENSTYTVNDTLKIDEANVYGTLKIEKGGVLIIKNLGSINVSGRLKMTGGKLIRELNSEINYVDNSFLIYESLLSENIVAGNEIPNNGILKNVTLNGNVVINQDVTVESYLTILEGTFALANNHVMYLGTSSKVIFNSSVAAIDAVVNIKFAQTDEIILQFKSGSEVEKIGILPLNTQESNYLIALNKNSIAAYTYSNDAIYDRDETFSYLITRISGIAITPKIYWHDNDYFIDINSDQLTSLGVVAWDGEKWNNLGKSEMDLLYRSITAAFMPDYNISQILTLGYTESNSTLDINFLNFYVMASQENNTLTWSFSNTEGAKYFHIERSNDGINFIEIEKLEICKDNAVTSYKFIDKEKNADSYYRIRIGESQGKFEYSEIISIKNMKFDNQVTYNTQTKQIFINSSEEEAAKIGQFDLSGRKISVNEIRLNKGLNIINIETNNRIQIIRIETANQQESFKII